MQDRTNHEQPSDAVLATLLHQLRHRAANQNSRPHDALRLAETQAQHLRELLGLTGALPDGQLQRIPRIHIQIDADLPVAGSAYWNGQQWIITLNDHDSHQQHRWTLLHELKHILDHPNRLILYGPRHDPVATETAERCADLFAATALMPTTAILELWRTGIHQPDYIARHFNVTNGAAHYRLHQVGLTTHHYRHPPNTPYLCLHEKGRAA